MTIRPEDETLGTARPLGIADAHTRRVTLNILRHAACCPPEIRAVGDRLAAQGWQWDALSQTDAELIYGLVDNELMDRAKSEFSADPRSIIDHRAADAECRLCGQKHIRFEFRLENRAGGRDHWTGSSCIITYGLVVDGETTAEAALAKLRGAINGAIKQANREDWRAEHPNHVEDMAVVEEIVALIGKWVPWKLKNRLGLIWGTRNRDKTTLKVAKAALKYYRANGFLTELKTRQVYDEVIPWARDMLAQAAEADPGGAATRRFWAQFEREHPHMNDHQRTRVQEWASRGWGRDDLRDWNRKLFEEIVSQHTVPPPPPPGSARKRIEAPKDDISDLPF